MSWRVQPAAGLGRADTMALGGPTDEAGRIGVRRRPAWSGERGAVRGVPAPREGLRGRRRGVPHCARVRYCFALNLLVVFFFSSSAVKVLAKQRDEPSFFNCTVSG